MFGHMEKTTILKQINVRENQRGNQEWTIKRKPKRQSRMDNQEKTKEAIKRNWQHWVHKSQDEDKQNIKAHHNTEN